MEAGPAEKDGPVVKVELDVKTGPAVNSEDEEKVVVDCGDVKVLVVVKAGPDVNVAGAIELTAEIAEETIFKAWYLASNCRLSLRSGNLVWSHRRCSGTSIVGALSWLSGRNVASRRCLQLYAIHSTSA